LRLIHQDVFLVNGVVERCMSEHSEYLILITLVAIQTSHLRLRREDSRLPQVLAEWFVQVDLDRWILPQRRNSLDELLQLEAETEFLVNFRVQEGKNPGIGSIPLSHVEEVLHYDSGFIGVIFE
jgi:hypothetical protein